MCSATAVTPWPIVNRIPQAPNGVLLCQCWPLCWHSCPIGCRRSGEGPVQGWHGKCRARIAGNPPPSRNVLEAIPLLLLAPNWCRNPLEWLCNHDAVVPMPDDVWKCRFVTCFEMNWEKSLFRFCSTSASHPFQLVHERKSAVHTWSKCVKALLNGLQRGHFLLVFLNLQWIP